MSESGVHDVGNDPMVSEPTEGGPGAANKIVIRFGGDGNPADSE